MPLMESITEINHTGKGRPQGTIILSNTAKTFKNVLDGIKPSGSAETQSLSGTVTKLDAIFKKAASTYGVSEKILKAVAKQESDFNLTAVSKAGAMGVMQLMPATAKELGVADPFDAEQNIMGGAKLLAQNLKQFGGDLKLALAAYNAGPGAVKKYDGIPPYKETQNYVKNIMADLEGDANIDISSILSTESVTGTDFIGEGSTIGELKTLLSTLGLGGASGGNLFGLSSLFASGTASTDDDTGTIDKDMFKNLIEILRLQMLMNTTNSIGDFDFDS